MVKHIPHMLRKRISSYLARCKLAMFGKPSIPRATTICCSVFSCGRLHNVKFFRV